MPSPQALQMVTEIRQPAGLENPPPLLHATSARSSMGAGIPLVPEKMVSRIEAGEFIEMAELLPDRLAKIGQTELGGCLVPLRERLWKIIMQQTPRGSEIYMHKTWKTFGDRKGGRPLNNTYFSRNHIGHCSDGSSFTT